MLSKQCKESSESLETELLSQKDKNLEFKINQVSEWIPQTLVPTLNKIQNEHFTLIKELECQFAE